MVNTSDYKLVVLGSGAVGKSSLTIQFIQGNFVERYDPTIEDSYRKQIAVDGKPCTLDILDTAGQEEYATMRDAYMRGGAGFILVYSITDKASFDDLWSIHAHLLKTKDAEEVPIVLVGNKCDLEDERQVSKDDGKKMAERFGEFCLFMESSAKLRINVDEAFIEIVRLVNSERDGENEDAPAAGAKENGKSKDKKKDAKKDNKKDAKKEKEDSKKKDKKDTKDNKDAAEEESGAGGKRKSVFGKKKGKADEPQESAPASAPASVEPKKSEPKKITVKDRSKKDKEDSATTTSPAAAAESEPKSPSKKPEPQEDDTPTSPTSKKPAADDEDKAQKEEQKRKEKEELKKKEEDKKREEEEKKEKKKREEEEKKEKKKEEEEQKKREEEEKKEKKKREEEEKKEKKKEEEEQKKREEEEKKEKKKEEEEQKKREKEEQKKREEEEHKKKDEERKRKGTMSRKAAAAAVAATSASPSDDLRSPKSSSAHTFPSGPYVPGKLGVPRLTAFEFESRKSAPQAASNRGTVPCTKISTYDISNDKKDSCEDLTSVDSIIIQKTPAWAEYRWVNIQEYSPEILNKVAIKFGIQQATIDDINADPDSQKTRFELPKNAGYLYFVCRRFSQIKQTNFVDNVHVLIFDKLVITLQTMNNDGNEDRIQYHSDFWKKIKASLFDSASPVEPSFILSPLIENIIETATGAVQGCADILEDIERKLLENGRSAEVNKQTFMLARLLYLFKRSLNQVYTTTQALAELPDTKFKLSQDLKAQLPSVQPLITEMTEMLDVYNGLAHMCFAFAGGRAIPYSSSAPSVMSAGPSLVDAEEDEDTQGKKGKNDKCRVS